jgi:hypothetical protein
MNRTCIRPTPARPQQAGVVTVGIATLLILVVGVALAAALTFSQTVERDSVLQHERLQALMIAESATQRGLYELINGTACASLSETNVSAGTIGTFSLTGYASDFSDTAYSGSSTTCRIRATGKVASGNAVRVIDTIVNTSTTSSTNGNRIFTCDIPTGTEWLIMAVVWSSSSDDTAITISTTPAFDGATMTQVRAATTATDSSNSAKLRLGAQNWYRHNPTTGSNIDGTIGFSASPKGLVIACYSLTGTDSTQIVDNSGESSSNHGDPTVSVSTSATASNLPWTGQRYIIDTVGRDNNGNMSIGAANYTGATRTQVWDYSANGAGSAGSYMGPGSTQTTPFSVSWSWTQNSRSWVDQWVAVRASTVASAASARIRIPGSFSSFVSQWREVTVPPT